jgi:hypothetical protein
VVAFAFSVLTASNAHADDPRLDFHTITTPHFWVHYHDGTEAFAKKVAVASEEAHAILSPLLRWTPRRRTHVVVNDRVDTANGSATVFGRKQINVFAMPPESDSVLGFYDDWVRVLVFHEYVHILHLDTILGIPPLVNMVIGKQWAPNQTLPRWYIEGIATYYESSTTRGGRVDSSLFKMYLRTAALTDEFFDLGAATGLPVEWPRGTVAYLYGGFFLDYVFEKHGEEFGTEFNHRYGRRMLPWALNAISDSISGESMQELWNQWTAAEAGKALATRVAVQAGGRTPLTLVTDRGGRSGFPRLRPGTNEVWFYYFDHERAPYYSSILTTGSDLRRRVEVEAGAGPAGFSADGAELLYSQSQTFESSYRYLDLYAYRIESGTRRRLTEGERAREPAVSPDNRWLAYVRNRSGTMELVVRDFQHPSAEPRVLVSGLTRDEDDPARWQQIATPDWSPDGNRLVFSWWRQDDGQRDLFTIDVTDPEAKPVRLTDDFAVDVDPHWARPDRIFFSSDRTGVYNVYVIEPESGEVQQVSNVVNGVFAPRLSPDGRTVWVSTYGPDGFDLGRFELPDEFRPAPPSELDQIEPVAYPEIDTSDFSNGSYNPLRWLAPLRFTPQLGVVTSGAGFGATIEGNDPIGHHGYQISGGFTTGETLADRGANVGISYRYDGLPVDVSLRGSLRDRPRTRALFIGNDYEPFIEREWLGRIGLSYPFRGLLDTLSFRASYSVDYTMFQDQPAVDYDPADLEPTYPEQGWFNELGFGLRYSNRESYPRTVSTASGWSASIGLDVQDPAIGSDFKTLELGYGFDLFLQNPIWPRHVLALFLDGQITVSDRRDPRRYAIGGNTPQDVFTSAVFQAQRRAFVVRGFPPNVSSGSQFQIGKLSYRFPILDLDHGFSTVPLFFRQLKGSLFVDTGGAFDGFLADANYLTGIGGEVLLESMFGYYLFGNFRLGYARGLGPDGIHEIYALFGGGF